MRPLASIFEPRTVAIVGASRTKGKVGHEVLVRLVAGGFQGEIYPVNPHAEELLGLRCYKDLASIGKACDLVLIAVPAKAVADVLRQCAQVSMRGGCERQPERLAPPHAVVLSSGFKESGPEGLQLEEELVQVARQNGIRVVGPNCIGIMAPAHKLNASFSAAMPEPGGIGYFSQSGSLLAAIVDMSREKGVGFSKLISMGNKADVNEMDVLKLLGADSQTRVIAGYLETIDEGDAFIRQAERIGHDKPILLMKAGETDAGAMAASSHTGRLVDTKRAYEAVFARAGIIRCPSITAQFNHARALASQPLPAGNGVVIVTNAGGAGIMAADAAEREGLELARLSDATAALLAEKLPAAANKSNPVDVLGDALADRFELALGASLDDPHVHSALVLLTPHAMTECDQTAQAIVRVAAARAKPVLACFLGASLVRPAIEILRAGKIPTYEAPEQAMASLKVMADYARWRSRPKRVVKLFPVNRRKVEKIIERHLRAGPRELGEMEVNDILDAYGFVTPKGMLASSAEQAASFAEQIGYPVVLKIWSADIIHKTAVGGVRTGISGPQEVMDAFDLMMYRIPRRAPQAEILGVLVQETIRQGRETILGMKRDPRYGPLMMFGTGGVLVEVLKDVAFYLAPLTAEEAKEMLLGTRTYQLLKGAGGQDGVDIDAVAEGLQRLSQLATEFPQIQEMDINPYMVGRAGTTPIAVDARITVAEP